MTYEYTESQKQLLRQHGLSDVVDVNEGKVKPGELKQITRHDPTGRPIHEFIGSKSVWMDQFKAAPRVMVRVNAEHDPERYDVQADNARYLADWLARNPGFVA